MRIYAIVLLAGLFTWNTSYGQTFTLKSNTVGGQATLKEVFTGCGGENVSPQLSWENPPEGTKSYAITMYDPDAPTGSGWWHWLAFNLPTRTTSLEAGAGNPESNLMPEGAVQIKTDYGTLGYGGPCPPAGHGIHTYILTVYALDVESLPLDASARAAVVGFNLNAHVLEKASI
ncbi:MAG: YbhB/YbcL family Raf kinase inhibitor-like protein, partial [Bacteroidota bacterium]